MGLMGSGKTTLANHLGSYFNCPVIDTDHWIAEREHASVDEIISRSGWDYFRAREAEFSREFVANGPCIIATGGGFPLADQNSIWLLKFTHTVYLEVSPETALNRISSSSTTRPLLKDLHAAERLELLKQLHRDRKAMYERFPFRVNADKPVDEVLSELIKIATETEIEKEIEP